MKIKIAMVLAALCLLLSANAALAERVEAYSGACTGEGNRVGNWVTVITFNDNGQPIRREGVSCDGTHWVDHCTVHILPQSPDPNAPSTHFTDLGQGGWVKMNITNDGRVTTMWGRDRNGSYWDIPVEIQPGPNDLN